MWFSDTTIRKLLAQKREVCQNANRTATPVKQQEVVSNVFYHDLQPVFIVLRFIGCFPIQNKGTGVFVFAKCSMLYLVTFLHYVAYLALSLYFSQDAALLFGKKDRQFDDMVYDSIRLIYFTSPHLHLITFLCKSKQIAAYLRHWYELEMLFFKTTGNYLVLKQRRNTLIMMFLAPILVFVSGAQQHFLFRGLSPWHKLTFCYSVFLNIYVDITWILICWSLTAASQAYNKELKIVLSDSSCFLLHTLRRYRGLWLQLCRLIEETGNVLCYQYIFHLLGCIVMLTLCLYAFLSGLLDGCLNLKHLGFGTMTTMFLVQKYLIINSAHEVMEQVGNLFSITCLYKCL